MCFTELDRLVIIIYVILTLVGKQLYSVYVYRLVSNQSIESHFHVKFIILKS
jgi:hypothetical protein